MCGLFGWFERAPGALSPDEKQALTDILGWKSEARGKDSWGILTRYEKWYKPHRALGSFKGKKHKALLHDVRKSRWIMGHTRQATQGDVSFLNCHPFHLGDFIMAHNGMLNDTEYKRESTVLPKGATDSETFLSWIVSKNLGVEGFLKAESYFGNAFEVYDTAADSLYLINAGRDLHFLTLPKAVVWASEAITVETACEAVFHEKPPAFATSIGGGHWAEAFLLTPEGPEFFKKRLLPSHVGGRSYSNDYGWWDKDHKWHRFTKDTTTHDIPPVEEKKDGVKSLLIDEETGQILNDDNFGPGGPAHGGMCHDGR